MRHTIYARTRIGGKFVLLHNLLVNYAWPVDHRNGNGLDCRRHNIRAATKSQNAANARAHRDNKCGWKGIWWNKRDKCWQAQICVAGRKQHLGCFRKPSTAKAAYNRAARDAFGEFFRA
jgi:hypothetical protein